MLLLFEPEAAVTSAAVVTEVGRQPWIVHGYLRVKEAATENTGVWITFIAVVLLYIAVGVTTVLVLRGMSRRYREQAGGTGGPGDESDVPYGPSDPPPPSPNGPPETVGVG